jgi:hypothetical protein
MEKNYKIENFCLLHLLLFSAMFHPAVGVLISSQYQVKYLYGVGVGAASASLVPAKAMWFALAFELA